MTSLILEAENLQVLYRGRPALRVERLRVPAGETLALIGPNGSGKSTLLRVLALLEHPAAGTLRVHGQPVRYGSRSLLELRRRTATVFQAPLLCDTTVYRNVALGLGFRRLPRSEIEARVARWLDRFGIGHLAQRSARTLSGGEAQRTSLARAFVLEPEVLFLDEPFAALDPPTRDALLLDLEAALSESGVTTVFVTHELSEALLLADRVGIMFGGKVEQVGLPDEIFSSPATLEVARFVGIENLFSGILRAYDGRCHDVEVSGVTVRVTSPASLAPGDEVTLCLRAADVALGRPTAPQLLTDQNVLLGTVKRVVPVGGHVRVHVDVGFELRALVTRHAVHHLRLAPGTTVRAAFAQDAPHLLAPRGTPPHSVLEQLHGRQAG